MKQGPLTPEIIEEGAPWLSGKRWMLEDSASPRAEKIAQEHDLPGLIAALLAQRDIAVEDVPAYLEPTLRNLMPDPFHLKDMEPAVKRITQAIIANEKIGILGDYDVDGATSSALLVRYFNALQCPVTVHIPDRQKEGYGPGKVGLQSLKDDGATLIITVDTGTLAHDALQLARDIGLETIVVDHHQGEAKLPPAAAIINPNRLDEDSPLTYLAAVGVCFMLLVALHKNLRDHHDEWRRTQGITLPDLREWLDIVALGTVCDVVPLVGLNRAFVRQGLHIMQQRQNAGIRAVMELTNLQESPTPYHLGFIIGPRINAGGRVGESDLGYRLLSTDNTLQAQAIAQQLDQYNKERRAIEAQVQEDAMAQAKSQETPILFAQGENWHEGIIGIVAGRLKEKFNQPAAVISWNSDGIGKASARSVKGLDIGAAVIAARQEGLLQAGGGHAMAAGFTLMREKFEAFQAFIQSRFQSGWTDYQAQFMAEIDATLPISAASVELTRQLEQIGPFGAGNPTPHFLIERATLIKIDRVGEDHLRCIFADGEFAGRHNPAKLKVMAFRIAESMMGQSLLQGVGKKFDLIGKLRKEVWQGRESVTFMLEDARLTAG
jgi:single-stranded-DNA-specific exonuclease